jgi:hypothetical protein
MLILKMWLKPFSYVTASEACGYQYIFYYHAISFERGIFSSSTGRINRE